MTCVHGTLDHYSIAKYQIMGFKVVYVFDISQTDGEPLAEIINEMEKECAA